MLYRMKKGKLIIIVILDILCFILDCNVFDVIIYILDEGEE